MNWSKKYSAMVDRNIRFITAEEQDRIKNSCVAVFGVGGLGGVIAELLVRSGLGEIRIVDNGSFEPTNLNRQIFCFSSTMGKKKVGVAKSFLKDINPELKIESYDCLNSKNIGGILNGCDAAILAIDSVREFLIISRAARMQDIPLVEGWALVYGNVRVFTKKTPSLEKAYGLASIGKDIDKLTDDEIKEISADVFMTLAAQEGMSKAYPLEIVIKLLKGEITGGSFSTSIWLTSVLMANETIKLLIGRGKIANAPKWQIYDAFDHKKPHQVIMKGWKIKLWKSLMRMYIRSKSKNL